MGKKVTDLVGKKFGRWKVLQYDLESKKWLCECSCNNKTIRLVTTRNLNSGKSKSCGCLAKELAKLKNTHEEFLEKIYSLVKDEYIVISKYEGHTVKVKMLHTKCNSKYEVTPKDFIRGVRCPTCYGTHKKDIELYKKEVCEMYENEYSVLGDEYINNKTKIKHKHNYCGFQFDVSPNNFLKGSKCPKCSGKMKKTTNQHVLGIESKFGNDFTVLSEYINRKTNIKYRHNKCGFEFEKTPVLFLNSKGCPKCMGGLRKDTEIYNAIVKELGDNEYIVLDEYINDSTKISHKHLVCGHIWNIAPNSFLRGRRCPLCNQSKGEKIIDKILTQNNIIFEREYVFEDLRDKECLRFDFVIFNDTHKSKDNIEMIIEYDGEFHFSPILGEKALEKQQYHDKLKDEYCKKHNIKLIRVPYWEFDNIELILEEKIKN